MRNCPHEPQQAFPHTHTQSAPCLGRARRVASLGLLLPSYTPKHVLSRWGAAPSALPATARDTSPPYTITTETSAPGVGVLGTFSILGSMGETEGVLHRHAQAIR